MSELDKEQLSSDDSGDEDFVPTGEDNLPSEEESDGENENSGQEDEGETKKRSKQNKRSTKRRKIERDSEEEEDNEKEDKPEEKAKSEEELWKEFTAGTTSAEKKEETTPSLPEETVTVTQVYNFAGEQVKVEKSIPKAAATSIKSLAPPTRGGRGGSRGGLSNILGAIGGKQQKLSILDKSKLDWQQFKQKEGISEELSSFNKGKDGYLEKQDFLKRADLRQFEMEKELRSATRKTLR